MYLVYKIINIINNKVYIGITNKTAETRWKEHLNSARNCRDSYVFHKAIRKYGKEKFVVSVLEENISQEEAKELEQFYINKYNSYYLFGKGYNMTFGGDGCAHKRGELSEKAKFTNIQADEIRKLLKTTSYSYGEICKAIKIEDNELNRHLVLCINYGKTYVDEEETYPLRIDGRVLGGPKRSGEKNPAAKLTERDVLQIIKRLETDTISQTDLAKEIGVTYNTINFINRCLTWKNLHNYSYNIREEYKKQHQKGGDLK